MAFSIKNDEADDLVRELAALTGESLTAAVTTSLRERLERLQRERERDVEAGVQRLLDFGRRVSQLPVLDDRPIDELIGYDEDGLPA